MRRHSLVVRLGSADRATVVTDPSSHKTELQFMNTYGFLDYGIAGTVNEILRCGLVPTESAIDLLLLASAVYCADTRIRRETDSQDRWTREIDLLLPVAEPSRWHAMAQLLCGALGFLTGDRWRVFFRPRPRSCGQLVSKPAQSRLQPPDEVCLFSGGLDSFIGAIDLLSMGRSPVLVSHGLHPNASKHQRSCREALRSNFSRTELLTVRSRIGFPHGVVESSGGEDTERSRSFLFFAVAAATVSGMPPTPTVTIPENGLITLNVPLDPSRIGSLSTRTTHPYFTARFEELLGCLGIRAVLRNPYRHSTKGEMVCQCRDQAFLARTVANTMSCSSPTKGRWQGRSAGHCGYCVACLIRRAALHDWDCADTTPYALDDLTAGPLNSKKAKGEHIRSFQLAIRRLNNDPARARILVHEPGPLTDVLQHIEAFAQVYLRGMAEVAKLLSGVVTSPDA